MATAAQKMVKARANLMDNDKLSEEQRVIHVSLNDFRALT